MSLPEPIVIWNREKKCEETEKVYGGTGVNWLYGTPFGKLLATTVLSRKIPSTLYGWYQSSSFSKKKILEFINEYSIPIEEFEYSPYTSFNDFFIRRFRKGAREFTVDRRKLPAFVEGRYLAFDSVRPEQVVPVKGVFLSPEQLLGREDFASQFSNGPMLIGRLCPVDYHRFHFPDWGPITNHFRVPGKLHSVNPVAIRWRNDIFSTNERQVSILETENFGKLAYIEVGALLVGKIVQTHAMDQPFRRGAEKGYFLFGASTVILMGEKGRWNPDDDLLSQTAAGRETYIRLGEQVGYNPL